MRKSLLMMISLIHTILLSMHNIYVLQTIAIWHEDKPDISS